MKLKTDASGGYVVQDGKPVYVADDGKELALDGAELYGKVKQLMGESRDKRLENEELKTKLAQFTGIEDPKAAREALETIKSIDGKLKADVEKVRVEVSKSYEAKLAELTGKLQATESTLQRELIGGGVARSKFAAEKSALPADLLLATFGQQLTVENGVVVGKRSDGSPIYSRANPGQLAGLDEALETLVSESPHRDHILKATAKGGSGAQPGTPGGGVQKTMPSAEFDKLAPKEQAARMAEGYKLTD
jgi:regulator of replication initiation timing